MDKSVGENVGFIVIGVNNDGVSRDGAMVLDVLVIDGDPLSELGLLKGDASDLGDGPVTHLYLDVVAVGVDAPVTGNDAGGLPLSALSYCSSPDVVVSCLGCSGSDSELSSCAEILQRLDSL